MLWNSPQGEGTGPLGCCFSEGPAGFKLGPGSTGRMFYCHLQSGRCPNMALRVVGLEMMSSRDTWSTFQVCFLRRKGTSDRCVFLQPPGVRRDPTGEVGDTEPPPWSLTLTEAPTHSLVLTTNTHERFKPGSWSPSIHVFIHSFRSCGDLMEQLWRQSWSCSREQGKPPPWPGSRTSRGQRTSGWSPQTGSLAFPSLSFFTYKMGIIPPPHRIAERFQSKRYKSSTSVRRGWWVFLGRRGDS